MQLAFVVETTVSPPQLAIPASGTASIPFQITIDPATRVGSRGFHLLIVDDSDDALKYTDKRVTVDVGYPPPWWQRHLRLLIALGAALLLLLAVAVFKHYRRQADRDVRGLKLLLYRGEDGVAFVATRASAGAVIVRTPAGERLRLKPGVRVPLDGDLALTVADARDGAGRNRRFSQSDPLVTAKAAAGPPAPTASQRSTSAYDDLL